MNQDYTQLIRLSREGDRDATDKLFGLIYDDLRGLAGSYLHGERNNHTLQPTALVHEAYMRLIDRDAAELSDRQHFFRMAAKMMRQALVDHARKHNSQKRGGTRLKICFSEQDHPVEKQSDNQALDVLSVEEALRHLESFDERKARVVELRFLTGLKFTEIAETLGLSIKTIEAEWYAAKAWLKVTLGA